MSKTLILSDVHNRWETVEKIIKNESPDSTIFLGDYFDDFHDNPSIIVDVADWFHHSINQPNRIHLCGNHDIHYWFRGSRSLRCSGYGDDKSIVINEFVKYGDWEKLKFFHILDNKWLLSHAGVHPSWIYGSDYDKNQIYKFSLKDLEKKLIHDSKEAVEKFYTNNNHWFGMPGFSRCRYSPYYGGIVWCDWNDEFVPIKGIHQIVGHTPQYNLTWKVVDDDGGDKIQSLRITGVNQSLLTDENSYNVCLDSQPGSKFMHFLFLKYRFHIRHNI